MEQTVLCHIAFINGPKNLIQAFSDRVAGIDDALRQGGLRHNVLDDEQCRLHGCQVSDGFPAHRIIDSRSLVSSCLCTKGVVN